MRFNLIKINYSGITAIEPEWLPIYANKLCKTLKILEDPKPRYDEETGKMYCTVNATYGNFLKKFIVNFRSQFNCISGQAGWSLPQAEIDFPDIEQKYWWLSFFILSGKVFPKLQSFRQHLLSEPNLIVKPWLML